MNDVARQHAPPRSLWRRLTKTPMRDLLRGRVSGRLDVQQQLDEAALPPPLPELVRTVVRRSRLSRLEKADVAAELIGHFRDGLDGGASAEDLARRFGEPKLAARLIGRARRRNRPRAWHVFRYTRNAIAALVVVYLALGLYLLAGRPNPAVNYVPRINAVAAAVPEAERAWPVYRRALLALDREPSFSEGNLRPRPGEEGWENVEAYLGQQQEALALARDAAGRPGLGFVVGLTIPEADRALWPDQAQEPAGWIGDGSLMSILLPHLAELRRLAKALELDAWRAAEAGDGETVVADLSAILSIARHARETPLIINDLVAFAIVALASQTTGDVLARYGDLLDEPRLHRLAHELSATDDVLTVRFEGERWAFEDIVQRTYTDDGAGDGRFTLRGLRMMTTVSNVAGAGPDDLSGLGEDALGVAVAPAMTAVMLSRRELLEEHARIMDMFEAEAARPLWEQGPSQAEAQVEQWADSWLDTVQRLPLVLLLPALGSLPKQCEMTIARRDAATMAVALHSYRRRHGAWPASAEDLVPDHLPRVPRDRFDGRPLRYRLTADGPVVYSVGADGDDDGGRPPADRDGGSDAAGDWSRRLTDRAPDGDWIGWQGSGIRGQGSGQEVRPTGAHGSLPPPSGG